MSKAKPSEFSKAASALSAAMERGASPEELAEARKEAKEATERALDGHKLEYAESEGHGFPPRLHVQGKGISMAYTVRVGELVPDRDLVWDEHGPIHGLHPVAAKYITRCAKLALGELDAQEWTFLAL